MHADRLGDAVELNRTGQKNEARQLLDRIVVEEPGNHRALWNRGLVSMEDGRFADAADWFDRAIAVDREIAIYHLWRGYAQARRLDSAAWIRRPFLAPRLRESLERAVELDGSSLDARRALAKYYERAPAVLGGSKRKAEEQTAAISLLERGRQPE